MKKNLLFKKITLWCSAALFSVGVLNAQDVTAPDSLTPDVTVIDEVVGTAEIYLIAKDSVGVTKYKLYDVDTNLIKTMTGATATTTVSGLVDDSLNIFYATALDAAGNESEYEPIGIAIGSIESPRYWYNNRRITTSKKISGDNVFEVSFTAYSSGGAAADAAVAVCKRKVGGSVPAEDWNAHAVIMRFTASGKLDARNGNIYAADSNVTYDLGDLFDVRFVISPTDSTYDVYVSKNGEAEILLADDYVFRDVNNYKELKDVAARYVNTPIVVSDVRWEDAAPTVEPVITSRYKSEFNLTLSGFDKYGVDKYELHDASMSLVEEFDGGPMVSTTVDLENDSLNVFYATAIDKNDTVTEPLGVLVGPSESKNQWYNDFRVTTTKKVPGDDEFEVSFRAYSAAGAAADAAVAVCKRKVGGSVPGEDWNAHAVIFRFNSSGKVDCRNNSSYKADSSVSYGLGDVFDVRFVISPTDSTFDCYISKNGEAEILLADDYYFRDYKNYTQLKDVAFRHVGTPIVVSDIKWDDMVPTLEPVVSKQTDTTFNLTLNGFDDFGVDGYALYDGEMTLIEEFDGGPTASTAVSGLVNDSLNVFYSSITDNSDNEVTEPVGVLVGSSESKNQWYNDFRVTTTKKVPGDDEFEVSFRAYSAVGAAADAAVAVCKRKVSGSVPGEDWNAHAVIFRFSSGGKVDCRDGGSYKADSSVSYGLGDIFDVRLVINPTDATFDCYISKNGEAEILLADDYVFRDVNNYKQLKDVAFRHVGTPIVVSDVKWDADKEAPSAPVLNTPTVDGSTITLTWTASTDNVGVANYKIFDGTNLVETVGDVTTATLSGVSTGTHSYTVVAVDYEGNESDASNAESVIISGIDVITASKVKVYPNPLNAANQLTIDLNAVNESNLTVVINDVTGKIVYSEVATEKVVTISKKLSSGMYIVTVKGQTSIIKQQKVVVQ